MARAVGAMALLAALAGAGGAVAPGAPGAPGTLGPSWTHVLAGDAVYAVASDASGEVVLAGGLRLHLSRDGGDAWEEVWDGGLVSRLDAVAAEPSGDVLYAGGMNGVRFPFAMYSHDGGATWEHGDIEDINGDGSVTAIAPHPTEPGVAVAALWYEFGPNEVLRTDDGGKTWATLAVADTAQVADVAWWGEDVLVGTALGVGLVAEGQVEVFFQEGGEVRSLEVHPEEVLYTSSFKNVVYRCDGGFGNLDVWVELPDEEAAIHVAVNPGNPDEVWAVNWDLRLLLCFFDGCADVTPPAGHAYASHVSAAGMAFAGAGDGVWRAGA